MSMPAEKHLGEEFYTVSEVAKILRVKKSFVYELIYSGRLKAKRLSERRIRIPKKSINSLMLEETEDQAEK